MREIEFRAKVCGNDYFVYGLPYLDYVDGSFFIAHSNGWTPSYYDPDSGEYTERTECEIETLQQYTGLKDKNGTPIFEGDIVSYIREELKIKPVVYSEQICAFLFGDDEIGDNLRYIEVIGNIYEHGGLLND